ncbi:MAG: hypothetical protein MI748_02190 [Opitutales bacterium]|nr:hypothetical protein [Opitutales bacterium]
MNPFTHVNEPEAVIETAKDLKAWVITVNMGYGHQRAAYPLRNLAHLRVIAANEDELVSGEERKQWVKMQKFYEGVSRIKDVPLIGSWLWEQYDRFQRIASLYPFRDQSKPSSVVCRLDNMMKKGFGMSIVDEVNKTNLPVVSTFFVPPLAASMSGIKRVYSIVTDVDINRIWVAKDPEAATITYLAPSNEARYRLLQYGVPKERVRVTGFPLPEENVATVEMDLSRRLGRLDTNNTFLNRYRHTVFNILGSPTHSNEPITITYAVGGAGAQMNVAEKILKSLKAELKNDTYRLNLIAGTRLEVKAYFEKIIADLGLELELDRSIRILYEPNIQDYFTLFNQFLRTTDILWTKPSELVFYAGLGIPLVMSDPLGAHEETNREWISRMGAGFPMENPRYANEWLKHWLESGMLAEAAFDAYTKAPRFGTENVKRILASDDPLNVPLRENTPNYFL